MRARVFTNTITRVDAYARPPPPAQVTPIFTILCGGIVASVDFRGSRARKGGFAEANSGGTRDPANRCSVHCLDLYLTCMKKLIIATGSGQPAFSLSLFLPSPRTRNPRLFWSRTDACRTARPISLLVSKECLRFIATFQIHRFSIEFFRRTGNNIYILSFFFFLFRCFVEITFVQIG